MMICTSPHLVAYKAVNAKKLMLRLLDGEIACLGGGTHARSRQLFVFRNAPILDRLQGVKQPSLVPTGLARTKAPQPSKESVTWKWGAPQVRDRGFFFARNHSNDWLETTPRDWWVQWLSRLRPAIFHAPLRLETSILPEHITRT